MDLPRTLRECTGLGELVLARDSLWWWEVEPNAINHGRDRKRRKKSGKKRRDEKTFGGHVFSILSTIFSEEVEPRGDTLNSAIQISSKVFTVTPPSVEFREVAAGEPRSMKLAIKNRTAVPRSIRLTSPHITQFQLKFSPGRPIAPGLSVIAEITFSADVDKDYFDEILVLSDPLPGEESCEPLRIPLCAYIPYADIQFDSFVNFGTVNQDSCITRWVTLTNTGKQRGEYRFVYDESLPIQITPTAGTLDPKGGSHSADRVKVDFHAKDCGVFRALAQVQLAGQPPRILDINASVVTQRVELVLPGGGGLLENVFFGSVYFGETRIVKAMLANLGPRPASFRVLVDSQHAQPLGGAADGQPTTPMGGARSRTPNETPDLPTPPSTPAAPPAPAPDAAVSLGETLLASGGAAPDQRAGIIRIDKWEGSVPAYGQVEVQFQFRPIRPRVTRGFSAVPQSEGQLFRTALTVEVVETTQKLRVALTGEGHVPRVSLSENQCHFGQCPVGERRDMSVTMKNCSEHLPLTFEIAPIAHFQARPATGRLLPLQSQPILFTFRPTQLGTIRRDVKISICGGVSQLRLRVTGEAAVPSALVAAAETLGAPPAETGSPAPQADRGLSKSVTGSMQLMLKAAGRPKAGTLRSMRDFEPKVNYVDPGTQTIGAETRAFTRRDIAEQYPTQFPLRSSKATYTLDERLAVRAHSAQYTNYLRVCREEREAAIQRARGATVPNVLSSLDLGLEHASGLADPEPLVDFSDVPLPTLTAPSSEATTRAAPAIKPKQRPQLVDTAHLIKHKFKAKPATSNEAHDCVMPLSVQDLMLISIGARQIDFGRVCVHSVTSRSLNVSNDLTSHVAVTVLVEDEELKLSAPETQIIPPGAMAGFDITIRPESVQLFRGQLTVRVNGADIFKVAVSAEVGVVASVGRRMGVIPRDAVLVDMVVMTGSCVKGCESWRSAVGWAPSPILLLIRC
ncbi:putative flagellar associated protein [Paratrimastix pyriformis]|uniref:Flagellar associated protein n=1 Tax=Paratrimastix pyriformis TaxID=342808 RepID=A0ABQ8UAC4_9EUKA|nr:putative flagellar associated protein [Paratrimastix pyriformis]